MKKCTVFDWKEECNGCNPYCQSNASRLSTIKDPIAEQNDDDENDS